MHVGANQERAAFERSSAISGDMVSDMNRNSSRRRRGKASCFRRGENKSDSSRQKRTDRQRRDAEGGPSRVYSSSTSS
ncbi:unnamed protein product, partial [Ectocarpus sp. 13 AM-2016]